MDSVTIVPGVIYENIARFPLIFYPGETPSMAAEIESLGCIHLARTGSLDGLRLLYDLESIVTPRPTPSSQKAEVGAW